jgi:hypothetical protein
MNDHLINELAHAHLTDLRHAALHTTLTRTGHHTDPPTPIRLVLVRYATLYPPSRSRRTAARPRNTNRRHGADSPEITATSQMPVRKGTFTGHPGPRSDASMKAQSVARSADVGAYCCAVPLAYSTP